MAKKTGKKNAKRYLNVRSGDTVAVIAGNDLGRRGRVLRTIPKDNKVLVEDVNVRYVHEKPGRGGRRQGERVEKEMPVDASNVMLICRNRDCTRFDQPVRVRTRRRKRTGERQRVCVKCEEPVTE